MVRDAAPRVVESQVVDLVRRATQVQATPVLEPVVLPVLEGAIPAEIEGVLLRNGPGRQSRGGVSYGHPFDGDGFIQRFEFGDGQVTLTAQWVKTREWHKEEAADRILYRGFGTNRPGGWLANAFRMQFKNAANTSIIQHAGRTLALWEGGLPHEIDPVTLETKRRYDYDGALLNSRSWLERRMSPELPFAAHPSVDPDTGELVSFGTYYGQQPQLLLHRVDASGTLRTQWIELKTLPFVHDFVLTKRWCVFLLPPATFELTSALLGTATPVGSLRLRDAPGMLLLVPRDGGPPVQIEGPKGFVFHWAQGFEADDGTVVLDGMHYDEYPQLDQLDGQGVVPTPLRITVDPTARTARWSKRSDYRMELPTTASQGSTSPVWGMAAPPDRTLPVMTGLGRLDGSGQMRYRDLLPNLPSEPLVVCDGRWLIVNVWCESGPTEVWVVDGDTLDPVARVGMPHSYPTPLHGTWIPHA